MNAHYADDRSPHAAACDRLPSLEARLAGESHQHDILHTYEHLLHQCGPMRRLMPLHGEAYERRVRALGMDLCATANRLFGNASTAHNPPRLNATSTWELWMEELWRHETDPSDCLRFENYNTLRWNPAIFSWPQGRWNAISTWNTLYMPLRAPPADERIVAAAAGGGGYGASGVKIYTCDLGAPCWRDPLDGNSTHAIELQAETVTMARHLDTLRRASGLNLSRTRLLVEFGGGTGQLSRVARMAGMTSGLHVVYDLPFMLLNQRYWLRHAGVAAYLVPAELPADAAVVPVGKGSQPIGREHETSRMDEDLGKDRVARAGLEGRGAGRGAGHRVALVSSVSDEVNHQLLPRFLNDTACRDKQAAADSCAGGGSSLFVATWSFSEASYSARTAIRPVLPRFDRLFINYRDRFDGIDNVKYLIRMVLDDFLATHSVCMWEHHLLLVRRSVGVARCVPSLGCRNANGTRSGTIDAMLKHSAQQKGYTVCDI